MQLTMWLQIASPGQSYSHLGTLFLAYGLALPLNAQIGDINAGIYLWKQQSCPKLSSSCHIHHLLLHVLKQVSHLNSDKGTGVAGGAREDQIYAGLLWAALLTVVCLYCIASHYYEKSAIHLFA